MNSRFFYYKLFLLQTLCLKKMLRNVNFFRLIMELVNCQITSWKKINSNMSSVKLYQIFNRYKSTFYNKNKNEKNKVMSITITQIIFKSIIRLI